MDPNIDPLLVHFSGVPEAWTVRTSPKPDPQAQPPIPVDAGPNNTLAALGALRTCFPVSTGTRSLIPVPQTEELNSHTNQYFIYHFAPNPTSELTEHNEMPMMDEPMGEGDFNQGIYSNEAPDSDGRDMDTGSSTDVEEPIQVDCIDPRKLMYYNPPPLPLPTPKSFFCDCPEPESRQEPKPQSVPAAVEKATEQGSNEPEPQPEFIYESVPAEKEPEQVSKEGIYISKVQKRVNTWNTNKPTWNVYRCDHPGCEYRSKHFWKVVKHVGSNKSHDEEKVVIRWIGEGTTGGATTFIPGETVGDRERRILHEIDLGVHRWNTVVRLRGP